MKYTITILLIILVQIVTVIYLENMVENLLTNFNTCLQ